MSVFTVFCVGTGHGIHEPNNTMVNLYNACVPPKWINPGPTGWLGNAQGLGMNPMARATVEAILKNRPMTVNLAGHSRGGILCHMIANDLMGSSDPAAQGIQQINIIALDPVNMSAHTGRGKHLKNPQKLGKYVAIVMENAGSVIFPSTALKSGDDNYNDRLKFLHMPGTHGSGTQPFTSAIGKSCHGIIKRYLDKWGTIFFNPVPDHGQMCEAFAQMHIENRAEFDQATGLVKKRHVSDDAKGTEMSRTSSKIKHSVAAVGSNFAGRLMGNNRVARITKNFESMAAAGKAKTDFRNTPYFFNTYHASVFRKAFPAIYGRFDGNPGNNAGVNAELNNIEANYPFMLASLAAVGMV